MPERIHQLIIENFGVGSGSLDDSDDSYVAPEAQKEAEEVVDEDAAVVRFVTDVISQAIVDLATDIHFEPQEGQFNFKVIDDVIAAWKSRGATVAFRVMTCNAHSRGYYTSPKWLFDGGCKSFEYLRGGDDPTSGGARMYEGMFSLMQMAKTCGALAYHAQARLPYISVLTHPTTAGVMASFATLGDLIVAEPGAMIGFAGPRVIKDTTQAELPPGFQTAEFLLDHGLIDAIVSRRDMKERLASYLDYLTAGGRQAAAPA